MSDLVCSGCKTLTIEHLIDLARQKYASTDSVPEEAHYVLHDSVDSLERSAKSGCSFCDFLLNTLLGYEDSGGWIADLWHEDDCNPEYPLFQCAKNLPSSDVKICLTSSNAYNAELADVSVLDRLLVQVGQHTVTSASDGIVDIKFPIIYLKLVCSRDDPVYVGRFRIGRFFTDSDLRSEATFSVVQTWLEGCLKQHSSCPRNTSPTLPTRVINVGVEHDWTDLRITHTDGLRAAYVALSHCWGGPISPLLTKDTLTNFQARLPFAELPANFQDAIIVTRRLAVRYLWIDSLCIIQDSKDDWAQESKKMGTIYRDSVFTISAMASRGSTQGIFPRNDQPKSVLPSNATLRAQGSGRAVTIVREEFGEESLKRLDSFGPLSNRGWCLQEAVLSPRHLYFGRDQVYWRCPAGYQAADGTSAGLRIPEYPLPYLSSCIFQGISPSPATTLQNSSLLLEDYNDLVQLYSQRSLTFGSDKLPAFSGVAGRLHDAVAGHYLAGIWSVDIVTALLWEREMSTCKHVVPYRAPSWSWAVTDEPILMNNKSGKIAKNLGPSSMTLLNHMVVPIKVDNPYGEVSSACISVKGLTLPLVRSTQHIGIVEEDYVTGRAYLDEAPPKYHPDAKEPDCSPSIFLVENDDGMYLLTMETGDRTRRHEEFHLDVEEYAPENYMALLVYVAKEAKPLHEAPYLAQGLILKPADTKGGFGDNRYERVGIFKFWQLNGWRIDEWKTKVLELV